AGNPVGLKERSTVGSASATGSAGGRTTWASGSGSDAYEADKMSEGDNDGVSSVGGLSDEGNASLVGFGEGANSTVEGPVSSLPLPGAGANAARMAGKGGAGGVGGVAGERAKMIDGVTYDKGVVDTAGRSPLPAANSAVAAAAAAAAAAAGVSGSSAGGSGMGVGVGAGGIVMGTPGSNQGTPAPRHAGLSGTETAERIVQERLDHGGRADGDGDVQMGEAGEQAPGLGRFGFEK
ncbi:MAG: hypothetical protein LQ340_008039, partial [Diploschistes diacapsis]